VAGGTRAGAGAKAATTDAGNLPLPPKARSRGFPRGGIETERAFFPTIEQWPECRIPCCCLDRSRPVRKDASRRNLGGGWPAPAVRAGFRWGGPIGRGRPRRTVAARKMEDTVGAAENTGACLHEQSDGRRNGASDALTSGSRRKRMGQGRRRSGYRRLRMEARGVEEIQAPPTTAIGWGRAKFFFQAF